MVHLLHRLYGVDAPESQCRYDHEVFSHSILFRPKYCWPVCADDAELCYIHG